MSRYTPAPLSPSELAMQRDSEITSAIHHQRRPFYKGDRYYGCGGIDATFAQEHQRAVDVLRGRLEHARQCVTLAETDHAYALAALYRPYRHPEAIEGAYRWGGAWFTRGGWGIPSYDEDRFSRHEDIERADTATRTHRDRVARLAAELAGLEGG